MPENYDDAIEAAREDLKRALHVIAEELRTYPTPVAGCDVQYTQLLSDQRKVRAALSALGAAPFIPTPRTLFRGAGVETR